MLSITDRPRGRTLRDTPGMARAALRWFTAFDPFGPYSPSLESR